MKIEIKHYWSDEVLFSYENDINSVAITLREALRENANLRSADLRSANLSGADLRSANLSGADLSGADLSGADLSGADLRSANLRSADLRSANLSGADLRSANLSGANLSGADLSGANLSGANLRSADLRSANLRSANLRSANLRSANLSGADLSGADLSGADLLPIKSDLFMVLLYAISEVKGLRKALIEGKVDGSTYTGDCACLVGTIANVKHANYLDLPGITPDAWRPAERFFLLIRKGDTPETSQASKIALDWVDEFIKILKIK